MDDEAVELGATGHKAGLPPTDRALDADARNLEFGFFYRDNFANLVGFLVVQGARPCVATDVAQESMIEVYRKWDSIDSPRTWVRTVASRKWWRQHQHEFRETPDEDVDGYGALLSEDESDDIESRHAIVRIFGALPPSQRVVMAWTYDGYQPTEIAGILGMNHFAGHEIGGHSTASESAPAC